MIGWSTSIDISSVGGEGGLEEAGDAALWALVLRLDLACSLLSNFLRRSLPVDPTAAFFPRPRPDVEEAISVSSWMLSPSLGSLSMVSCLGINEVLKAGGSSMKNRGTKERIKDSILLRSVNEI